MKLTTKEAQQIHLTRGSEGGLYEGLGGKEKAGDGNFGKGGSREAKEWKKTKTETKRREKKGK